MQHQHQQDHTTSTPPDDDSTTPTLPTFSKLSVSSSEKERASDQTRDDDQYPTSEDEEEDEEEEDEGDNSSALPSFKLPTFAPQLDFLSLPSPIFGGSFVDLLSLPGTSTPDRPPSRLRTSSRVSVHDRHDRAPTLNFSNPRPDADRRTRRAGKEEDCFVTAFPVDPLEVPVDDPARWGDADWEELKGFLLQRGYEVPAHQPKTGRGAQAERVSDSLPLHLHLVPINDESWELDVVEYISSAGIRTKSQAQGVLACLPVVAIVAVSEDWTAVLVERWESPSSIANFGSFAKDVASVSLFVLSLSSVDSTTLYGLKLTSAFFFPFPLGRLYLSFISTTFLTSTSHLRPLWYPLHLPPDTRSLPSRAQFKRTLSRNVQRSSLAGVAEAIAPLRLKTTHPNLIPKALMPISLEDCCRKSLL